MNRATVDLNPKYKLAYDLMLQGLSDTQIAAQMGMTVSCARQFVLGYETIYGDAYFVRWIGGDGSINFKIFRAANINRARMYMKRRFGVHIVIQDYGRAENELEYVEKRIEELGSELVELRGRRRALRKSKS